MSKLTTSFEAQLINYIVTDYFNGDSSRLAERAGYTKQQIEYWRSGHHKPQKKSLRWLLSAAISPEFKVVCEFSPVDFKIQKDVSKEVGKALNGHDSKCGIYAFYDSMCNLIYIGKASSNLKKEIYQQLTKPLGMKFPKAVTAAPTLRLHATRYISAYEIPSVEHLDYPKHVEALFLRLAKPIGNKVLGGLSIATPPKI